jgi:hypothetical protein
MRTRHRRKALAGLVATAITIAITSGLPSPPASANSATGDVTGGTLTVINADSTVLTTENLGSGGPEIECSPPTVTWNKTGTFFGSWSKTVTTHRAKQIGTQWFVITRTWSSNGTWVGPIFLTSSSSFTQTSRKSTATNKCTAVAGPCTFAVSDISLTGTDTASGSNIAVGDSMTFSGGTNTEGDLGFEVAVTGTAGDCGSLIGADDGAVTFSNVTIVATSVP